MRANVETARTNVHQMTCTTSSGIYRVKYSMLVCICEQARGRYFYWISEKAEHFKPERARESQEADWFHGYTRTCASCRRLGRGRHFVVMFKNVLSRLLTETFFVERNVRNTPLLRRVTAVSAPVRSFTDVKDEAQPPFDTALLEVLVCPLSKKPLR